MVLPEMRCVYGLGAPESAAPAVHAAATIPTATASTEAPVYGIYSGTATVPGATEYRAGAGQDLQTVRDSKRKLERNLQVVQTIDMLRFRVKTTMYY